VIVLVTVPEGVADGDFDVNTLNITSILDSSVWQTARVTTTAQVIFYSLLPLVRI
jgi:hypothetical protein